jgi:alkylhydroperoxidase/carboxymuconolactone decarboxylase family protein YurZ
MTDAFAGIDARTAQLRLLAEAATRELPEGEPLDDLTRALVRLGLAVSVTSLSPEAIGLAVDAALDAGASIDQVEEIIALVSGLGVHSLMVSQAMVLQSAAKRGLMAAAGPLDPERQALWDRHVGDDPFWIGFETENPGFLDAMLRLCPSLFTAFFDYCAVPWKIGSVRARTKELVAIACDVAPTHVFGPGFRLHLRNAITLGASRRQIMEVLDIAGQAPGHDGVA